MREIISVVIPVYNVEAYLRQCLDSVLSQSYSDLQVIVIDDGSTDKSGAICDEYAEKDSRILVIHQKNGGAAAAKNAGLRAATGTYLSFLDSDDYLEPGAYEYMVDTLRSNRAEVIQCRLQLIYTDSVNCFKYPSSVSMLSTKDYLKLLVTDWTCGLMTDKLYYRSLFDGIFFEEGHRIDDEYFTYQGIMNATKIIRDDRIIYNYRQRRSSVMQSPASAQQIVLDRVDYLSKRRKNIIARFPELRNIFDVHFLEALVILSQDSHGSQESISMIRQQLKLYLKEKDHTHADIHLWPSLVKIYLGLSKPAISAPNNETIDITRFFD